MSALALQTVYDSIASYFASRELAVQMVFGFGSRKQNVRTPARIAFEPGNGDGPRRPLHTGIVDPVRQSEEDEAVFGTFNERFTLYLTAHDDSAPTDQAAQIVAVRILHDAVCDAVSQSDLSVTLDGADWMVSSEVQQHGAGIVLRGYVTALMYADTANQYREVFPWTALTRVQSNDERIDDVLSPPLDPGPPE